MPLTVFSNTLPCLITISQISGVLRVELSAVDMLPLCYATAKVTKHLYECESVIRVSRSDVVMSPFISLLKIWKVITLINNIWKAKLESRRR